MQQNRIFKFPYEPYDIQIQLMNKLYDSFENGFISIVESPTGTGKSLSILCAISTWLEDFKRNEINRLEEEISKLKLDFKTNNDNDWISDQLKQISNKQSINDINVKLDLLKKHIQYAKDLKKKNRIKKYQIKKELLTEKRNIEEVDDADIDDYDMLLQNDEEIDLDLNEDKNEDYFSPKIYYCSRTHSQLSQFINEFKKTKYFKDNETSLMMVPLSSRMNYCINCNVNRFNNLNMINEKCNDLKNSKQKCSMVNNIRLDEFREQILSNVYDLEEIVTVGKQIKACPYYSSKLAISDSEIVTMPYNILLHKSTRENFGIKLKNSIVIIDEAHNLLETIYNVHCIELKLNHLLTLLKYLSLYMTKFYSKFNAQNLKYLKQLVFVCRKLSSYLENSKQNSCHNPLELSIKINIENINFHELLQFIDRSRIAIKLHMFSTTKANNTTTVRKISKCSGTLEFLKKINTNANNLKEEINPKPSENPKDNQQEEFLNSNILYLIKDFLNALHSYNVEGKILINVDQNDKNNSSFKYILLSPSSHFKDILQECRSVVLCGGTMKPFDDYINQLFKPLNIPKERTLFFSCNHIITDDKLVALGCTKGPNRVSLNFSYSSRNSPETIKEIGLLLVNLVQLIPKGIVIFFPSYDYQEYLFKQWSTNGIYRMLEKQKRIFKEPKKSSLVPNVLNSYTKFIHSSKQASAILFSVIGGKMSEGINFSDDLGRGIIVIGLPYANRNSPELMAKINYLNQINSNAGNEYYENLCMRSVNQSIGRAIRHKNDYAAIILIDERYGKRSVHNNLSNWIQTRFQVMEQFSGVNACLEKFFANKKER